VPCVTRPLTFLPAFRRWISSFSLWCGSGIYIGEGPSPGLLFPLSSIVSHRGWRSHVAPPRGQGRGIGYFDIASNEVCWLVDIFNQTPQHSFLMGTSARRRDQCDGVRPFLGSRRAVGWRRRFPYGTRSFSEPRKFAICGWTVGTAGFAN
jgi:hypothetical protein